MFCKEYKDRTISKSTNTIAVGIILITATILIIPSLLTQQQEQTFAQQATTETGPGSVLRLARTNVPIDIPLLKGYENGNETSHYLRDIATDVSDEKTAAIVTNLTGFKVNYAPALAQTPETARAQAYAFTNGIAGDGPFGFQLPVVNAKPGDEGYSPLWQVNEVTWNENATARELRSVEEITAAEQNVIIIVVASS